MGHEAYEHEYGYACPFVDTHGHGEYDCLSIENSVHYFICMDATDHDNMVHASYNTLCKLQF